MAPPMSPLAPVTSARRGGLPLPQLIVRSGDCPGVGGADRAGRGAGACVEHHHCAALRDRLGGADLEIVEHLDIVTGEAGHPHRQQRRRGAIQRQCRRTERKSGEKAARAGGRSGGRLLLHEPPVHGHGLRGIFDRGASRRQPAVAWLSGCAVGGIAGALLQHAGRRRCGTAEGGAFDVLLVPRHDPSSRHIGPACGTRAAMASRSRRLCRRRAHRSSSPAAGVTARGGSASDRLCRGLEREDQPRRRQTGRRRLQVFDDDSCRLLRGRSPAAAAARGRSAPRAAAPRAPDRSSRVGSAAPSVIDMPHGGVGGRPRRQHHRQREGVGDRPAAPQRLGIGRVVGDQEHRRCRRPPPASSPRAGRRRSWRRGRRGWSTRRSPASRCPSTRRARCAPSCGSASARCAGPPARATSQIRWQVTPSPPEDVKTEASCAAIERASRRPPGGRRRARCAPPGWFAGAPRAAGSAAASATAGGRLPAPLAAQHRARGFPVRQSRPDERDAVDPGFDRLAGGCHAVIDQACARCARPAPLR